jgi:hypothetical protein
MASLVVAGDVSGSVTLSAPSAAGSTVITLPTTSGTMVVTGGAQTVQFAAGSAASPSITFTGDTNTGIFSPAADTIAFSEGGVESMRIDSSGNVGIGVTPSAWSGFRALQLGTTTSLWSGLSGNTSSFYTNNAFYNGTNRIYLTNGFASEYIMGQGLHIWYTAASGTAGGTVSFSESMRIDTSGNVGIGVSSPGQKLDVSTTGDIQLRLGNAATGAQFTYDIGRVAATGLLQFYGNQSGATGYIFSGVNGERMRIDSSGNLLVGTTTVSGKTSVKQTASSNVLYLDNSNATTAYGMQIAYTGRVPNSTGEEFIYTGDSSPRFVVRSNGGIANYSANNVNLSDEREKTNIQLAGSYLDKICAIPVKTFNYIDQNRETDDGLTLGVIAQDVQSVAPELVMESDWSLEKDGSKMRLSIYQTDLQYALMKAIQELNAKVEAQAAEIAALKGAN